MKKFWNWFTSFWRREQSEPEPEPVKKKSTPFHVSDREMDAMWREISEPDTDGCF